jgi:hypothetical protein
MLSLQQVPQQGVCGQVVRPGQAAGQDYQVEGLIRHCGQGGVRHQHGAAAGGYRSGRQTGDHDLDTGAAQQVDQGDGLQLFAANGEGDQGPGHVSLHCPS